MALAFYSYIRFYKLRYSCAFLFPSSSHRRTDAWPLQRVHSPVVDVDVPHRSLPLPHHLLQDGRSLRFHGGRNCCRCRSLELAGRSPRVEDGKSLFFSPFSPLTSCSLRQQEVVAKHFLARVLGLIVIPAIVYLFWFWVHFAVLTRSGTGDEFMSPAFQQTLADSPLTALAEGASFRFLPSV
jgi:hypothetical protein